MLALVTGGTGFVGSNLVAGLTNRGIGVRVLRRPTSSMAGLDGLRAVCVDYWRYRRSNRIYRTNVEGTRNVLAAALRAGVERLVLTSSIAALGARAPGRQLTEADRFNLRPRRFPYGQSKHLAECELRRAVAAGLAAVTVNPAVVIGPHDVNRISSAMIGEAARGRPRVAAPGGTDFVAVADVVQGHVAAAERGRVGERYILAGETRSFRDAFATVCDLVNRPGPAVVLPLWTIPVAAAAEGVARFAVGPRVPIDGKQMRLSSAAVYADGSKARKELGVPCTPFRAAVQSAYDWYLESHCLRKQAAIPETRRQR
jgi:dihydroflavonol-4-reductase